MRPGPPVERLTRRLAETPEDFNGEPRVGESGAVSTAALVHDLLRGLGHDVAVADLAAFSDGPWGNGNHLRLVAVAVWLLADDWATAAAPPPALLLELLGETLVELAAGSRAEAFVRDQDRREELARTALRVLGLLPEGETMAQAADRLSAVSAAERRRLLEASRAAEERARAVREALIRKAAEESADKYTRE